MENEIKKKEIIKTLCELIDDKDFPARRGIVDYIESIISQYDYAEAKELYEYAQSIFEEYDRDNQLTPQEKEIIN